MKKVKTKQKTIYFSLTESQEKKIKKWSNYLIKIYPNVFKKEEDRYPLFSYIFTPTGIGDTVLIKEMHTGLTLDITEFKSW